MIITTAGRTNEQMVEKAKEIAYELQGKYIERNKRSVNKIQHLYQDGCIVVGKERLELYPFDESDSPFFFHPNSAMFRIKRLINGGEDPFIQAANLQPGKSLLDCTLGLASDSIVASFVCGKGGKVMGVEGNRYLAYLVKCGLQSWQDNNSEIMESMKRIQVNHNDALTFLKNLPANSFHCVYFDPMFEESLLESDGIHALKRFAIYENMTEEWVKEAVRVASDRVVLKDHFRSKRFTQFSFSVQIRKTSKFHFGVIEKGNFRM